MDKVYLLDSTLRDGAQSVGISFSVQDKLKIVRILDDLYVDYIEAGNPGSNPKDMEFFAYLSEVPLKHAKITAFGATRKKNIKAEEDVNLRSLLSANTDVVSIFGKSWDIHVTDILRAELSENLAMIGDTIRHMKANGKEVIYDAEHFFDGYRANPDYALATLQAAYDNGADCLCLCDTNGGSFPDFVQSVTKLVKERFPVSIGIHAHDDAGMAAANSVLAVTAGANHVQGTLAGFGERCGNANLATVLANLQLKVGCECVPVEALERLTSTVHEVADISNISVGKNTPYVGANAFAHKGGMHVDGVMKNSLTFEHVSPSAVGNNRRVMMSEVAGRSAILEKVKGFYPDIKKDSEEATRIIDMVKQMEHQGYQFEGAEASFELEVRKLLGTRKKFFELQMLSVLDEQQSDSRKKPSFATIKVLVGEQLEITAAEGMGPVNAIDAALRKALEVFYPEIGEIRLTDYKVRVLDSESATAATVRVLIESTDGHEYWTTVGVAVDIMQASTRALMDSIEYKLLKSNQVASVAENRTESA